MSKRLDVVAPPGASSKSVALYLAHFTISVARLTRSVATLLLWFSCTNALDHSRQCYISPGPWTVCADR